jgi:hypothetical protein
MSSTPPTPPTPSGSPTPDVDPMTGTGVGAGAGAGADTTVTDDAGAGRVPAHTANGRPSTAPLRLLAILVLIGGVILTIAGVITWIVVTEQLADEHIVVSDDADRFAGDDVDGPFTAYAQAEVINDHALEETGGLTYAQLEQDDPRRETVMTASFLRASLFTSVVSFGVAAFAFGLGLLLILIAWALLRIDRQLRAVPLTAAV